MQGLGIPEVVSGHPLRVWFLTELDIRSGCPELGLLMGRAEPSWSQGRIWLALWDGIFLLSAAQLVYRFVQASWAGGAGAYL